MACACESSAPTTPGTTGCCSIASDVPNGQPIRLEYHNAIGGASSGVLVPIYRAEMGSPVPLAVGETSRIWLYWIQVVTQTSADVNLYFGASTSADSNLNSTIARGMYQDNGGIVANMPLVPLSLGGKVYVKSSTVTQLDVVGYGVLA